MQVAISYDPTQQEAAQQLAQSSTLPLNTPHSTPDTDFLLHLTSKGLELRNCKDTRSKPLRIDFLSGKYQHRRRFGGGKGQQIAKAVGLNKYQPPSVLDTTAGLGRDAFVLATLGCRVSMLERSLPVYLLLQDALTRAQQTTDEEVQSIIQNMTLRQVDSVHYLASLKPAQYPDVIYIDPMFPPRDKAAKVKKEMAFFHALLGSDNRDNDVEQLIRQALSKATKRIVVKRPRLAAPLHPNPAFQITGKTTRYDMYLPQ